MNGTVLRTFVFVLLFSFSLFQFSHAGLTFDDTTSVLELSGNASLVAKNAITGVKGTIVKGATSTISGEDIVFDGGIFDDNGNIAEITGAVNLDASDQIVLDGSKKFKATKGQVLRNLKVRGSGNRLEGEPLFSDDVVLQDNLAELTVAVKGRFSQNIVLNGGKLTLEDDLYMLDGKMLTGSGHVLLNGRTLSLGAQNIVWTSDVLWEDASDIQLSGPLTLNSTWTFSGSSVLCGQGNILTLGANGNIVLYPDSDLLIKDIYIRGVSGTNIRCLGDTSVIKLQLAQWVQDGNYTFTKGAFQIEEYAKMSGEHTFAYQSSQTSTVGSLSKLVFSKNFTFSYDPPIENKTLIEFVDDTSQLDMKWATLHVTTTGIQFLKGGVCVSGICGFVAELDAGGEVNKGITFGDKTAANDCVLEIAAGSILNINQGSLFYKNVSPSSIIMTNLLSTISTKAGAAFVALEDFYVGSGRLEFDSGSTLGRATSKDIVGSVHVGGPVTYDAYSSDF